MKRTPLQRKTPLRNKKPMARSRTERRARPPKAGVEFPPHVREQARSRAGFRCEANTGKECVGRIDHYHHVQLRSQGGKGTLENCLCVCRPCHDYIHANPTLSYMMGWLKRMKGLGVAD